MNAYELDIHKQNIKMVEANCAAYEKAMAEAKDAAEYIKLLRELWRCRKLLGLMKKGLED